MKRPSHRSSVEEEHVRRYQTGPSTPGEGLRVKRSDFCNEDFRLQEATCFSSLDSVNSAMDRQCGTWTQWSPLSCIQWIMDLDVTRFRKTSMASLASVGSSLKFTHTCACEYGISWKEGTHSTRVMHTEGKQKERPLGQEGVQQKQEGRRQKWRRSNNKCGVFSFCLGCVFERNTI